MATMSVEVHTMCYDNNCKSLPYFVSSRETAFSKELSNKWGSINWAIELQTTFNSIPLHKAKAQGEIFVNKLFDLFNC